MRQICNVAGDLPKVALAKLTSSRESVCMSVRSNSADSERVNTMQLDPIVPESAQAQSQPVLRPVQRRPRTGSRLTALTEELSLLPGPARTNTVEVSGAMPNKKYTECTWCNVGWAWKSEKKYYPACWHCGSAWPGDERANQARLVESAGNQQRSWSLLQTPPASDLQSKEAQLLQWVESQEEALVEGTLGHWVAYRIMTCLESREEDTIQILAAVEEVVLQQRRPTGAHEFVLLQANVTTYRQEVKQLEHMLPSETEIDGRALKERLLTYLNEAEESDEVVRVILERAKEEAAVWRRKRQDSYERWL
eukprot:s5470_g1.t1